MNDRERELRTLYLLTRLLAMGTQGSSLLRTILREALRLTGGRGAQVLLLRPDRRTLLTHLGEGEGLVDGEEISADAPPWSDVIREGKVVRLRSMRAVSAHAPGGRLVTLGIPLLARGDVLGILTLRELSEAWTKQDREPFLEALANLAAHAPHNDALDRDLLRQKEELCTLTEVSCDITASLDLDEVFRRVVRHAARLLRGQAATLMLVEEMGQRLRIGATYGGSQTWMRRPPLDLATSFLGEVVRSGSPLAVLDLQDNPHDPYAQLASQEGLSSLLCVPLKTSVRPLGLLTVYTTEPRRFRAEEVELLLALAAQSATAIENARLYRAVLDTQEQLRRSERLAALGSMSAGLAHEIRNPLHTMHLLAYAMQKDGPRSGTLSADLEVLQSEIGRLTLLVEQFLDFARPKRPTVTPQKLQEIMEETLLLVRTEASRRGIRIDKRWPGDLPMVWVDGAQLKLAAAQPAKDLMGVAGNRSLRLHVDRHEAWGLIGAAASGLGQAPPRRLTKLSTTRTTGSSSPPERPVVGLRRLAFPASKHPAADDYLTNVWFGVQWRHTPSVTLRRRCGMITKFDSLYAGHIDMDNVGYAGTAVNDRRFPNEHLVTVFDKAQAMAQLMDRLGYDTFWTAEHHFQYEGYECIPNVLMLAVHLAQVTQRLRFGCGFNITPMWHPLRLAEDFATADILTGGRVTFGVGRGYHTREVETFGSPLLDQPANRELFEEQVEIIFKAFNEESFSHQGKHYTLPPKVPYRGYELQDLTLVPRPLRRPVECWQPIQGGSQRALDFMAKMGIKGVVGGGSAEGGAMHKVVMDWHAAQARVGRHLELGEGLCFGYHFYLADSREQGIREAGKYYEENLKMFGPLRLVRALTDRQIEDMADPKKAPYAGLPKIEDAIDKGGVLCGSPDDFIEHLKKLEERYPGLDRVMASLTVGIPKTAVLEQLERFATEVMPAFKQPAKAPALVN